MKLAELLTRAPDATPSIADTDPELAAALDADFTAFITGVVADMDRADAETIQAAIAEKGERTLH